MAAARSGRGGPIAAHGAARLALAAFLVALTAAAHARIPDRADLEIEGRSPLPSARFARAAALGHEALVADYYWLQAVQLVGGSVGDPSRHARRIGQLIDLVTSLDPWVGHPYRFAAVWLTDSEESVRTANRLLERGVAHHPGDWRNRFYLGFNHFFYLEDNRAAADVLEGAVRLPGAPVYLRRLVARLRADHAGLETAAAFLMELARNAPDEYARAEYEKALDEIETERRARVLDAAREAFKRRHGRDIRDVAELASGPSPVLRAIPEEPHGWEWVIDEESGVIKSSYYWHRYTVQIHGLDQERRERWREQREARAGSDE